MTSVRTIRSSISVFWFLLQQNQHADACVPFIRFLGKHYSTPFPPETSYFLMIVLAHPPGSIFSSGILSVPPESGYFGERENSNTLISSNTTPTLSLSIQSAIVAYASLPLVLRLLQVRGNQALISMYHKVQRTYLKLSPKYSFTVLWWEQSTV